MTTITTQLYSYKELSPEAQARVITNKIRDAENDECLLEFTSQEMLDSLKAVCEACNLRLVDYSFGIYCRNWNVSVNNCMVNDLEGNRALAWFLRVLIDNGYARPKHFRDMEFPGVCGFTGVCFDEDIVECVWKELLDGRTVRKAFDQVAKMFCDTLENEYAYLTSKECIMDYLDEDADIYTEEGEEF
jgi:hypothetical protein